MSTSPPTDLASAEPPGRRFSGPSEFRDLVRDIFARAQQEAWREIVISDWDFAEWPLGERAVAQALQDWSRSGRRFTVLASRYDEVVRRHARFVTWRGQWSHIIDCWACPKVEPDDFPSAIWTPSEVILRLDVERSTGLCTVDAKRRTQVREQLQEWQRRCSPGLPATTLGL